jgi:hypothetical protein
MQDRDTTGSSFLSFDVNQGVAVFVGIDERITTPPLWLQSWRARSDRLITTDGGGPGRKLYSKLFGKGHITLGANRDSNMTKGRSMYSVVIVPYANRAEQWYLYP